MSKAKVFIFASKRDPNTGQMKISKGSDQIIAMVHKNSHVKEFLERIDITCANDMLQYRITHVPAVIDRKEGILYGSDAVNFLHRLIKSSKPIVSGSCDGSDFCELGDDDTVSFDPSKIKDVADFVIPSAPVGRSDDIDRAMAAAQADRDLFDNEIKHQLRR